MKWSWRQRYSRKVYWRKYCVNSRNQKVVDHNNWAAMMSRQLIIYFHLDVLVDKVEASEILTATFFPGPVYIGYCTNFSFFLSLLDLVSSFLEKAFFTLPSSLQRVYDFLPTWCFASPLNTPLAKEKSQANKSKTLSLELHVATTYWSWPKIQNHTLLELWKIGPGTSTKGHKRVNFSLKDGN